MFNEIQTWTYQGNKPSHLTFFEAIALSDLENKWVRLSADDQRKIIGFPVFGKQQFKIDSNGNVKIAKSVCFGTDYEIGEYTSQQIKEAALNKKKLDPTH